MFSRHSSGSGRSRSSSRASDSHRSYGGRGSVAPEPHGSRSRRDSTSNHRRYDERSSSVRADPCRSSSGRNSVSSGSRSENRSSSAVPTHRRTSNSLGHHSNSIISGVRDLLRGDRSASHSRSQHESSSASPSYRSSSRRGSVSNGSIWDDLGSRRGSSSMSSYHRNSVHSNSRVHVPGFGMTRNTSRLHSNNYENADYYRRTNSDEGDTTVRNITNNSGP